MVDCHCERSDAIQLKCHGRGVITICATDVALLDCFGFASQ